ncbi:hypothetical protein RND81_03G125900 [Saponaria officinalis]|uniref:HMA domain-containing protein n=1 Tax=Saponaria officinalis TaxID=3572 RepID=A0AAW1M522_SAPOF
MARGGDENNQQNNRGENKQAIVLKVYLHCEECAKPIVRCLQRFPGVTEVNVDMKNHTVSVKGNKDVDPKKLADTLQNKRNKLVEIVSPKPKDNKASQQKKPQPKIVQVILSIYIHCENCGNTIMRNIQKMPGVQSVEMNIKALQVTVKGEFEPHKLMEYVDKQMGKRASIVKTETVSGGKQRQQQQDQQQRGNENNNNNNNNNRNTSSEVSNPFNGHGQQELDLMFMSQIFNDENSQACTIM